MSEADRGAARPPRTWTFQAQPRSFDIDGYLATNPATFPWLVKQHAEDIRPGDQVSIWRAIGGGEREISGVIAEARVLSPVTLTAEDAPSMPFWRDPTQTDGGQPRVRLRLIRVASRREIIQRDWLTVDPVLRDARIMRQPAGTNFDLSPRTCRAPERAVVANGGRLDLPGVCRGLWVYHQTYGKEISRTAESPVAEVAVKIGRAVTGVYNKVMNFRSIDPRDTRAGMPGSGAIGRKVWTAFYHENGQSIRGDALEHNYRRLWPPERRDLAAWSDGIEEADLARGRTPADIIACRTDGALPVQFQRR